MRLFIRLSDRIRRSLMMRFVIPEVSPMFNRWVCLSVWLLGAGVILADPQPLASVNTTWTERDPWLSPDGYTLYFASNRNGGDFDIYQSQWDGTNWSAPEPVSPLFNTDFDETRPTLSADGQRLLFISHRERFYRGPWLTRRQHDGSWSVPEYIPTRKQYSIWDATLGRDGRSIHFQGRVDRESPPVDMRVTFDPVTHFWSAGEPSDRPAPENIIPNARWRFTERDGNIWYEPLPRPQREVADAIEHLLAVAASSTWGPDEYRWISEAQNLIDGLEDTGWCSAKGAPTDQQGVLLSLRGAVRYVPGLSRIHALRIHTGPVAAIPVKPGKKSDESVNIPEDAGPATRPTRLRILGGMDADRLSELAVVNADECREAVDSPWCRIQLREPKWLRYLKIEVLAAAGPQAPFVSFNEVQAFGAGESVAPPRHHVSKDAHNNITVDGEPFFPIYLYNAKSDLEFVARMGFNAALMQYDVWSTTARRKTLDRAHELDIKVIGWVPVPDDEYTRIATRSMLLDGRHHPALLGYLMSDEAGWHEPTMQADERRAAFIRQYDPDHYTSLNDLYPKDYPRSSKIVDVFSIDPYPHIIGQPFHYQGYAIDVAYESVQHAKPVLVVNASWHGPRGRLLSPLENRLTTYLALIHKAKGISWYALDFSDSGEIISPVYDYPDHWASILQCVGEIRRLTPVLLAPDTPADSPLLTHSRIDNPSARLDVMIKEVKGEVWMLAANCEPAEARVNFSFGWAEEITIREVMAENPQAWSNDWRHFNSLDRWPPSEQRVPVRGARPIEMTFGPYGVRVFRMQPSGPIGPVTAPVELPQPLAMINASGHQLLQQKIGKMVADGQREQARGLIEQFQAHYADRVSPSQIGELIEALGPAPDARGVLADFGWLAEQYPDAEGWPRWVFTIVNALVKEGRAADAQPWLDKLVKAQPASVWRATAEALVHPASARNAVRPSVVAKKTDRLPEVNGEIEGPLWASPVTFRNTVFTDPSKHPQDTSFVVAYNEQGLYIAIRAVEPRTDKLSRRVTKDDKSVWSDDCIDLYFDLDLDCDTYYRMVFNPGAIKWDGQCDRRGGMDKERLEAEVKREVKITDDAWQLELMIPFDQLGMAAPRPGTVWGFGLQRWRNYGGRLLTVWGNEKGTALDRNPETLGFLIFE